MHETIKVHLEITSPNSFDMDNPPKLPSFSVSEMGRFVDTYSLATWTTSFLTHSASKNKPLLRYMKRDARFVLGPIFIELEKLVRIAGPGKKYNVEADVWEERMGHMMNGIKNLEDIPPGVAYVKINKENGTFAYELADGAHRHEALRRLGYAKMPVVVWVKNVKNLVQCLADMRKGSK